MPVHALDDRVPELPEPERFWIALDAYPVGGVRLRLDAGVWFGAVLRGSDESASVARLATSRPSESPVWDRSAAGFDGWLGAALTNPHPTARNRALPAWASAPGALRSHPGASHPLPLLVVTGSAGDDRVYHGRVGGEPASCSRSR